MAQRTRCQSVRKLQSTTAGLPRFPMAWRWLSCWLPPAAGSNHNRHRPPGLSPQHGRQSCTSGPSVWYMADRSLFKMILLPSEAVSSPDVLDKDTPFCPDFCRPADAICPRPTAWDSLKPLPPNSTRALHLVTNKATSLAGGPHIPWPTTTLVVTLQCLTHAMGPLFRRRTLVLAEPKAEPGRRDATCAPVLNPDADIT